MLSHASLFRNMQEHFAELVNQNNVSPTIPFTLCLNGYKLLMSLILKRPSLRPNASAFCPTVFIYYVCHLNVVFCLNFSHSHKLIFSYQVWSRLKCRHLILAHVIMAFMILTYVYSFCYFLMSAHFPVCIYLSSCLNYVLLFRYSTVIEGKTILSQKKTKKQ